MESDSTFLAKAGRDIVLINHSIEQYAKPTRDRGSVVRLDEHPEGMHGFDLRNDDDTPCRIIRNAIEFTRSHMLE